MIAGHAVSSSFPVGWIGCVAPLKRASSASENGGWIIDWTASIVGNHELLVEIDSLLKALSVLHRNVLSSLARLSLI